MSESSKSLKPNSDETIDTKMDSSGEYRYDYQMATEVEYCPCNKKTKHILCSAFCFIPWMVMLVLLIYLGINYDVLHKSNANCTSVLNEKHVNESIMMAKFRDMKQKNDELKTDIRKLTQKLDIEQEKLKNAEIKIDLYVKTLKDLKYNYEMKIDKLNTINNDLRVVINKLQNNLINAEANQKNADNNLTIAEDNLKNEEVLFSALNVKLSYFQSKGTQNFYSNYYITAMLSIIPLII